MKGKIVIEFDTEKGEFKAEAWKEEPGKLSCQKIIGNMEKLQDLCFLQNQFREREPA